MPSLKQGERAHLLLCSCLCKTDRLGSNGPCNALKDEYLSPSVVLRVHALWDGEVRRMPV